jgi:SAM-dependent methyltransferase
MPSHRRDIGLVNMPDIAWNKAKWSDSAMWTDGGEIWSAHWGSSEIQWWTMIWPRIAEVLPASSVVEIAPGHGRWTHFLLDQCESYIGFDVAARCTEHCRIRFANACELRSVRFETNDGASLPGVADASVDFVFSFDSLVHVEQPTIEAYLSAIARVLRPGGGAFLHHSNYAAVPEQPTGWDHERGRSQSAASVRAAAESVGLHVLVQEPVSWGGNILLDCFSSVVKPDGTSLPATVIIENPTFWADTERQVRYLTPYQRSRKAPKTRA